MATIYGGYAKSNGENFIKVYLTYTVSSSNTKVTVDWSAGCHIDSGHRTNAKITVSCWGESKTVDNTGWEGGNHKMVYGSGDGWDRTTSAYTKTVTAKLTLANGNTSSVTATINIPALQSWNVTYNANGGTGAPATQKKYYGKTLTLSSTKPTKSGYTFVGWNTSSSATSSNYNPGSTYSTNNTLSLYAIWKKTITITYNANGGTGAPASQSQTIYNSTTSARFTIPSTKPTKTKYNFLGWATSATATSASYNSNTAYNFSNSTTLYAVWKLAYISPQITNSSIRAIRTATNSASDTEEVDNGEYIYLSFAWTAGSIDGGTTTQAPQCKITATANGSSIVEYGPTQLTQTPFTYKLSTAYSADTPVSLQIELYDTGYETYKLLKTVTVATAIYPQDLIVDNGDVYMGIMHPAVQGQPLTLRGTVIDGTLTVSNSSGVPIQVNNGTASTNTYIRVTRTDKNPTVGVSIGINADGTNHGLYSNRFAKWIVYADVNGVIKDGSNNAITNKSMFASGHETYSSIATNSYADKSVSFGKTFASAPNVVACLSTSGTAGNIGNVSVSVFNISTTGCTVRVFNNRGSALSPAIEWIAVGI